MDDPSPSCGPSLSSWDNNATMKSDMGDLRMLLREELRDALAAHHKHLASHLEQIVTMADKSSAEKAFTGSGFPRLGNMFNEPTSANTPKSMKGTPASRSGASSTPSVPVSLKGQAPLNPVHAERSSTYSQAMMESMKKVNELQLSAKTVSQYNNNDANVAHAIVKHKWFESFFGFLILTNSIFIGVQIQYQASNETAESPVVMTILNNLYTFIFFAELVLRLLVDWRSYLCSKGSWSSAGLDIFVVTTSLAEFVMQFFDDSFSGLRNFSALRVVRVLRVFRILRAVRTMSFFRDFRILLNSIYGCLKSLAWAMCLFFLVMYLFGVVFTQTIHDHIMANDRPVASQDKLQEFYGTLFASIFTLFKSMSGGISWHEVVEPLFDVSGYLVGVFVTYICFVVFAVMNVVSHRRQSIGLD